MSKAKSVMSGSFHPWAECLGPDDDTPCIWALVQSSDTRALAKEHATLFPGHRVRVVAEKVDLYRADPS